MAFARVDPHVKVLDERVKSRAIDRGMDAIVYAPHFTPWPDIVDRAARFSDDRLTVVPAREIFTGPWDDRKHVLALDLTEPIPDFRSLTWTMDRLRAADAVVLVPHPAYLTISLSPADIRRYRNQIDAVEVFNPKYLPWHDRRARQIARTLDLPMFASSYSHLPSSVGSVWIELDRPVESPADVVSAFHRGGILGLGRITGREMARVRAAELAHICWENTASKLARRLAPGLPRTHPEQSVYRG